MFTGVVAAAGGVRGRNSGQLRVCGALWARVRRRSMAAAAAWSCSTDAIAMAARLTPLPARAQVLRGARSSLGKKRRSG